MLAEIPVFCFCTFDYTLGLQISRSRDTHCYVAAYSWKSAATFLYTTRRIPRT